MESGYLHREKLAPFLTWLDQQGIPRREGRGEWEVAQVNVPGAGWKAIFRTKHDHQPYTVLGHILPLMKRCLWELKHPPKPVMKPVCPYCKREAVLQGGDVIYPHRPDLHDLKFWSCGPCGAYVGCHKPGIGYGDGTRPLGRLANAQLRIEKVLAHARFDALWKDGHFASRQDAYAWLAGQLGIPKHGCHIGEFDVDQCRRVVAIVTAFHQTANSTL